MKGFIGLTKRNLMIYFKDIMSVIFSLLTSIIVFVLYLIFLKGTYMDSINNYLEGLEMFVEQVDIDTMVSMIFLVGILGSAIITVPFSCLQTVIKDRENKIDYDILSTSIKRYQIILSYFASAIISAFIVTSVILTVGLLIINSQGDLYMSSASIATIYGIVLIGSISSAALFLIMVLFFKTSASSSAFFGILSAASGFVIGAYIPLSQFSENVQTFCNLVPATQITVLIRNNILNGILDKINKDIGGIDNGAFVEGIKGCFNFEAVVFGNELTKANSYLYVMTILVLSLIILVIMYSKTYKKS